MDWHRVHWMSDLITLWSMPTLFYDASMVLILPNVINTLRCRNISFPFDIHHLLHSLALMLTCNQYIHKLNSKRNAQWQPDYVSLDLIQLPLGVCLLHSKFVSICWVFFFLSCAFALLSSFPFHFSIASGEKRYISHESRPTNDQMTYSYISADCSKSFVSSLRIITIRFFSLNIP